jgi:hypothetical protein
MTKLDTKIGAYYALHPMTYGFLEAFNIKQCLDPRNWSGLDVTMHLSSSSAPDAQRLHLEFTHVHDLRIGSFDGLLRYTIDIRSLVETQQEGVNYRVVENECGLFAFMCADFTAKVV